MPKVSSKPPTRRSNRLRERDGTSIPKSPVLNGAGNLHPGASEPPTVDQGYDNNHSSPLDVAIPLPACPSPDGDGSFDLPTDNLAATGTGRIKNVAISPGNQETSAGQDRIPKQTVSAHVLIVQSAREIMHLQLQVSSLQDECKTLETESLDLCNDVISICDEIVSLVPTRPSGNRCAMCLVKGPQRLILYPCGDRICRPCLTSWVQDLEQTSKAENGKKYAPCFRCEQPVEIPRDVEE